MRIYCLVNSPEKAAEKIHALLKLYLNIEVSIVVSTEFEGYYGAKTTYSGCVKAIGFKFYTGNGSIILLDKNKNDNKELYFDYHKQLRKILALFDENSIDEAVENIKTIMEYAFKADIEPAALKKDIIRLVETLERKAKYSFLPEEPVFENSKELICNAENGECFFRLVSELINRISARLETEDKTNYREEINKVIKFINSNYSKKITINMISKCVNLNESYICRVFKNETGKSIMNYINEVRMEKAAALIRGKDMPFKSIACQVGIDDQFYFNKVFKKYFGVSPTGFKNNKKSHDLKFR